VVTAALVKGCAVWVLLPHAGSGVVRINPLGRMSYKATKPGSVCPVSTGIGSGGMQGICHPNYLCRGILIRISPLKNLIITYMLNAKMVIITQISQMYVLTLSYLAMQTVCNTY